MSDRDAWCTPRWLTDLLPPVTLDPCSNERSTVRAVCAMTGLGDHDNGLTVPWRNAVVFCNPPYSDVLPWAVKLSTELVWAAAFLVNVDPSTAWWRALTERLPHGLFFHKRIQFVPPPGVKKSTNNKPQVLLMDDAFLALCSNDLLCTGTLWSVARRAA